MKPPRGALSKKERRELPKTTKVYWGERPLGGDKREIFSKTIIWFDRPGNQEYHVNFAYPVYFFLNYWDAYAHVTKINAGITDPWVPRRSRQS